MDNRKKKGVVCTIKLPDTNQVRVLAVHLSHRSRLLRIDSARMIAQELGTSDLPLIAAGDFNSTRMGLSIGQTVQNDKSAMSVLLDSGVFSTLPLEKPTLDELTFSAKKPDQLIDWILVSQPGKLVSKKVHPVEFSDHRPVVGVVSIQ